MSPESAELLAEQAAKIAMATAEKLKKFDKDTCMLMYAKQMGDMQLNTTFPEGTAHKKMDNKQATQKLEKMMHDAKIKWKYASDKEKKRAMDMEKIVLEGNEKIRALYAGEMIQANTGLT